MQKQDIFLKIKVHFVLYYKYYSYLCNTEKEIKDRILPQIPLLLPSWLNV